MYSKYIQSKCILNTVKILHPNTVKMQYSLNVMEMQWTQITVKNVFWILSKCSQKKSWKLTALDTGEVAWPTLVKLLLVCSKGEFEDVSDLLELLCIKWPLTSGLAGGRGVRPLFIAWVCPLCCPWSLAFPWGLTISSPPPDWIWDNDNTRGGWWWPI